MSKVFNSISLVKFICHFSFVDMATGFYGFFFVYYKIQTYKRSRFSTKARKQSIKCKEARLISILTMQEAVSFLQTVY